MTFTLNDTTIRLKNLKSNLGYLIKDGEASNSKRAKMEVNRDNIIVIVNELEARLKATREMQKEINIALKDYQNQRKKFIEDEIQSALDCVFEESYKVELQLTPYRDSYKSQLKLYIDNPDTGVRQYIRPTTQNGGLCRQVLSASASVAIAKLMDCHMLIWDEAFNGGDPTKIRKVQRLVKSFIEYDEENFIVMNEHNCNVYSDLPSRVYDLVKNGNGLSGSVAVVDVTDYIGSNLDEIELG